jgi:hypothetical protein
MASSQDNSAAKNKQSGDSKRMDQVATVIVLRALGQIAREHAIDVYEMVGIGRGDPLVDWTAAGFDDFQEVTLDAAINEAALIETVSIPSAKFQTLHKQRLAFQILGDSISDDDSKIIKKELEDNLSNEQFQEQRKAEAAVQTAENEAGAEPPTPPKKGNDDGSA